MQHMFTTLSEAFHQGGELPLVVFDPTRQKVPVKLWVRALDGNTEAQVLALSSLEVVLGHVALMPDAHMGIGCSIGTVFATREAIVPSTVGVDLGCGMMAVRFPEADLEAIQKKPKLLRGFHQKIRALIPTGFNMHQNPQSWDGFHDFPLEGIEVKLGRRQEDLGRLMETRGTRQLGTLGGGNHFVELCVDEDGKLWLMLHSGSRGLGNLIGTHFMARARVYCDQIDAQRPRDLNWLPTDHPDGRQYLAGVAWSQAYARENRHHMMQALLALIEDNGKLSRAFLGRGDLPIFTVENHHNFVQQEDHFGETVWVHRKGAVSAQVGEWGILPGSMATGSYIVRGKGNSDSLCSCAHGSGRKMSRTKARKSIDPRAVERAMKGIVGEPIKKVLDEAPQAYKDLEEVMRHQDNLIEQVHRLRPLLNVKGH